jgi:hypothetical protein
MKKGTPPAFRDISPHKSIRKWPEMLAGDEVLATAILSRLLHHCRVVHVDGSSYKRWEVEHCTRTAGKKGGRNRGIPTGSEISSAQSR